MNYTISKVKISHLQGNQLSNPQPKTETHDDSQISGVPKLPIYLITGFDKFLLCCTGVKLWPMVRLIIRVRYGDFDGKLRKFFFYFRWIQSKFPFGVKNALPRGRRFRAVFTSVYPAVTA